MSNTPTQRAGRPGELARYRLSTTAYALLGLLALREWTTYELAQQMRRGVGDLWSAARSMVYAEPKHLVAAGLATMRQEATGRRRKAVYSISPAGRSALRSWLQTAGAPPALQFEGILKVLLADSAELESSRASIAAARSWAESLQEVGREVASDYLAGRGAFQGRFVQVSLTFDFLWKYSTAVIDWADWAAAQLEDHSTAIDEMFRHPFLKAVANEPSNTQERQMR